MRRRPSLVEHETLARVARAAGAPPPPARPVEGECCGRLCEPCVWDYYARAFSRWATRHEIDRRARPANETPADDAPAIRRRASG